MPDRVHRAFENDVRRSQSRFIVSQEVMMVLCLTFKLDRSEPEAVGLRAGLLCFAFGRSGVVCNPQAQPPMRQAVS